MPNWCSTDLVIKGTKNQLQKIDSMLQKKDLEFNSIKDIDYNTLYIVDILFTYLEVSKKHKKNANKIIKDKLNKSYEEFISIVYNYIRSNKRFNFSCTNSSDVYTKTMDIINSLCDSILASDGIIKYVKVIRLDKNELNEDGYIDYNSNILYLTNILPDNPFSFIHDRYTLSHDKKYKAFTKKCIDDWYYDRSFNRIGTKWNPEITDIDYEDDNIMYHLDCAWAPCTEFARWLTIIFDVETEVTYTEEGCGFAGKESFKDGDQTEDIHYDMNTLLDTLYIERFLYSDELENIHLTDLGFYDILSQYLDIEFAYWNFIFDCDNPIEENLIRLNKDNKDALEEILDTLESTVNIDDEYVDLVRDTIEEIQNTKTIKLIRVS